MSEPIHGSERLPSEVDANLVEHVLVWSRDQWLADHYGNVSQGDWWKPIDQTPPPEPPKPKRGVLWSDPGEWRVSSTKIDSAQVAYIEKLPTDPDWDELLEAIDKDYWEETATQKLKRILEARNRNAEALGGGRCR